LIIDTNRDAIDTVASTARREFAFLLWKTAALENGGKLNVSNRFQRMDQTASGVRQH